MKHSISPRLTGTASRAGWLLAGETTEMERTKGA